MTATLVLTGATTLTITLYDDRPPGSLRLVALTDALDAIDALLACGYLAETERQGSAYDDRIRQILRRYIAVQRLSYNSPLEIGLHILPAVAALPMAARGVLRLMSSWQDYRVQRAQSDVQVTALGLLEDRLGQHYWAATEPDEEGLPLSYDEIERVADLMNEITSVRLDTDSGTETVATGEVEDD